MYILKVTRQLRGGAGYVKSVELILYENIKLHNIKCIKLNF